MAVFVFLIPLCLGLAVIADFRGIRTSYARNGRTSKKARQVNATTLATGILAVVLSLLAFAAEAHFLLTH
ncbi:hypothetical protein N4G70_12420 [Streptomyces sp. ASQP_92]|uniref:hypothetical protein n=1 Tax=Streptomyces sp. ASQP_92 TaxID=2979116 RepID=UPI0021BF11D0|nr:hypothetical protein [Streptomyces sp. ASQP_92]MCT9089674.1 hypothetical protein [Streptomyces sp. ASQP_92]